MNAAASQRDIHASPCQYTRATRWIAITMLAIALGSSGFIVQQMLVMRQDVKDNTKTATEANVKFQYIQESLTEIKAQIRALP